MHFKFTLVCKFYYCHRPTQRNMGLVGSTAFRRFRSSGWPTLAFISRKADGCMHISTLSRCRTYYLKPIVGSKRWSKQDFDQSLLITGTSNGLKQCRARGFSSESENKKGMSIQISKGPFRWLDVKLKLFLLRIAFDSEFKEEEFLVGAKQAICHVSFLISKGEFDKLNDMLSDEAIDQSRQEYNEMKSPDYIIVTEEDIQNISITNLAFHYDGKGKKWADILVTCLCSAKSTFSKKLGKVEIFNIPLPRVLQYTFVREYTPGITSQWTIARIIHNVFDK